MQRFYLYCLFSLAVCLSLSAAAFAGGPNPDNYPLRVHILKNVARPDANKAYAAKNPENMADYIEGQGAADLFENGQPRGFLYTYSCVQPLVASAGYATYPARWKKKDKVLEILVPQPGKPWNMEACELQPSMRPGLAYFWSDQDDKVVEESAAVFKDWMAKNHYDPEKDMDLPTGADADSTSGRNSGYSSSQHTGSH